MRKMTIQIEEKQELKHFISVEFIAISDTETVASTLQLLRTRRNDFRHKFAYIYVTNKRGELTGVLSTRSLLTEGPSKQVSEMMSSSVFYVRESDSMDHVRKILRQWKFLIIPVVSDAKKLIGVIEASKIGGIFNVNNFGKSLLISAGSKEEILGRGVFGIVLKRIPWLLISVTTSLVCAYILGIFIGQIESIVALVLFIPVVLGSSGSAGAQLAQITFRELNYGGINLLGLAKLLGKEIVVAFLMACIIFVLSVVIGLVWRKPPVEGTALAVSIVVAVTAAGMLGIISPMMLRGLRIRSEFATGLFALLICDIVALVLYFMVAFTLVNPSFELG